MAAGRGPERDSYANRQSVFGGRLSRYDVVLVAIPVALLASLVVHLVAGVSLQATLVPAAIVGLLALVDAVFLNPPTAGGRGAA